MVSCESIYNLVVQELVAGSFYYLVSYVGIHDLGIRSMDICYDVFQRFLKEEYELD